MHYLEQVCSREVMANVRAVSREVEAETDRSRADALGVTHGSPQATLPTYGVEDAGECFHILSVS